jgi:hypothetical protein
MIGLFVPLEKILLVLFHVMVFLNLPSSKPAFAKKFVLRSSIPNILGTAAIKRDSSKILLKGKTVSFHFNDALNFAQFKKKKLTGN